MLSGRNGWPHVLSDEDHQSFGRAVGELISNPAAAGPAVVGRRRAGHNGVAERIDGFRAAEVDSLVDALGNQAGNVTKRVLVHSGRLPLRGCLAGSSFAPATMIG